jgi:tRNA 5-methylaminomethyl-2-thiouridine biosynthesis bifunctional protein
MMVFQIVKNDKTATMITPASIYVNENRTPASRRYNDVYFSGANGAQETDYVFIGGNDLLSRWSQHSNPHFCIAETGFGTGLNFFRVSQHFQHFRQVHPSHILKTLIFISTEKHPLSKKDAADIMQHWKQDNILGDVCTNETLSASNGQSDYLDLCKLWLAQYPLSVAGIHRRNFSINKPDLSANITLDLHYSDATDALAQIQKSPHGVVDAWFLDGFTPSKNSSMWTPALYAQMASLSKIGCSFATFTAASEVKRGLQIAGFCVHKQKGFERKREMLLGIYSGNSHPNANSNNTRSHLKTPELEQHQAPYFGRPGLNFPKDSNDVTIVGNGLAGAIMALKLTQRGKRVNLLWQGELPSDFASGNPIGGFYPQLNAQHNAASQIQMHSFLYASEFYKSLNTLQPFSHDWCGALQIAFNDNTRTRLNKLDSAAFWPRELAHLVDAQQASDIANIPMPYPCLHIVKAGWIKPPSVVSACLEQAKASGLLTLQNNLQLINYKCIGDGSIQLALKTNEQRAVKKCFTQALVLAMGSGSKALTKHVIPLRLTRGQVEMVSNSQLSQPNNVMTQLKTLLCHKGYFTPASDGFHALGSTYIKEDTRCDARAQETDINFNMHIQSIQHKAWQKALGQARLNPHNYSRAAIRCSTPDHLPVVGAMPDSLQFTELADLYKALPLHQYQVPSHEKNVFIITGLGSRGLTTAPLMAEVLVSQMLEEPMPLTKPLLDTLNPNRFIVRSLIRREPWQT